MGTREIVFLGTSSQVPTRARGHHALFLRWDDLGILFDPGEGTQRQLIHAGISASQISHIAITHFHGDHCLGLAGIVQRISLDRLTRPVEVLYPGSGQVYFDRLRRSSIYDDHAPIVPRPIETRAGDQVVSEIAGGRVRLIARALDHVVDCNGYRLQEADGWRLIPEKLEALGVGGPAAGQLTRNGEVQVGGRTVRVEDAGVRRAGQSFAFVMDTRECEGALALARGADLLVAEATYLESEAREAHERGHLTAAGAARIAREAGVRRLALTHFSQRYTSLEPFADEARAIHPDTAIGVDLDVVAVPGRAG